jgi:CDP-paratose 2-epimerase
MANTAFDSCFPSHIVVTGGAGFIGSNYARRLIGRRQQVTLIDNLSRPGSEINLELLRRDFGQGSFNFHQADIRSGELMNQLLSSADAIVHLAGQVAVTSSVVDPVADFEINARGTLNILEAARRSGRNPFVIYASTNKVYGDLEDVPVSEGATRYFFPQHPDGISESQPLDFHSPYGCSKGAGDQYVRDYSRMYGIPTVVMRQSCIYGPSQFGIGDQGWVAWILLQAHLNRPVKIFGNGKQVRDLLYVEDLLDAYDAALTRRAAAAGHIFNIGGGARFTLSVWEEFRGLLQEVIGKVPRAEHHEWRPGDQKCFICDIRHAKNVLLWEPKTDVRTGVREIFTWVQRNQKLFDDPRIRSLIAPPESPPPGNSFSGTALPESRPA